MFISSHILRNVVSLCDNFDEVHFEKELRGTICCHLFPTFWEMFTMCQFDKVRCFWGNFDTTCVFICSHNLTNVHQVLSLMTFHFMGTSMQHVLISFQLLLSLVSKCHKRPILGSTQWEDCLLFVCKDTILLVWRYRFLLLYIKALYCTCHWCSALNNL